MANWTATDQSPISQEEVRKQGEGGGGRMPQSDRNMQRVQNHIATCANDAHINALYSPTLFRDCPVHRQAALLV